MPLTPSGAAELGASPQQLNSAASDTPGLLSVERVVTFLVGPIILALAGWLSAEVATLTSIQLSPELVGGAGIAGVLGATALIYKWLDGRSKHTLAQLDIIHTKISAVLGSVGVTPTMQEGFVHIALADLEHLAEHASQSAVNLVHGHIGVLVDTKLDEKVSALVKSAQQPVQEKPVSEPPPTPIPAAVDPAPATPVAAQPGAAQAADAGAASTQ